jgi:hypothetical protein
MLCSDNSQIIDPENMVSVHVGEQQCIEVGDVGTKRLRPEIWATIYQDENARLKANQGARMHPVFLWQCALATGSHHPPNPTMEKRK